MKICGMVTDISWAVRTTSCQLLGRFNTVTTAVLMQTLSKQVLGTGRLKLSRSKSDATSAAGDFDLSQLDVNLLDSGSAGAFVHGLEDEMVQVRMAAVESMCELGSKSRLFAERAIDFLVDMFNDEIEQVQLNAICSLSRLGDWIQLRYGSARGERDR